MSRYSLSEDTLASARRVTPGGSQTLSKKAECFVEGAYPCFLSHGLGPSVWDIDHNQYLDFICGLGCLTLGYNRPEINQAIKGQLLDGISFSLPHALERKVAARLVDLIPCAEQVRFVKTGSEACSGAVRIARMATGGDRVLYVGYHGWHDGYTSSRRFHPGIPDDYEEVNLPLEYNNLRELDEYLQDKPGEFAAVIMEPTLIEKPDSGYLQAVKDLVHEHEALLIFDEMIMSGRWTLSGGQDYFHVIPDLAVYGKFLGNGMPLACIAGPEEILKYAWAVSGTFGGETLSLAACDAVLDIYATEDPVEVQWQRGEQLVKGIREQATLAGVALVVDGYPVHPKIRFLDDPDRVQMSILLQELAENGVLIHPGGLNISAAMTEADIGFAVEVFGKVLHGSFEKDRLRGLPYRDALRAIPK